MGTAGLVILAAGLSMDAFAVSVCKGLSLGRIKLRHMLIVGLWFGGFQALMPLIGYLLGSAFAQVVSDFDHWIACALLVIIGSNMIREALGNEDEEDTRDPSVGPRSMILPAVATSVDALAVGVTLGSVFGAKYKTGAEITGGVVLILIGLKILAEGLGWL